MPKFHTVTELSEQFGVSKAAIYKLVKRIPHYRLGGRILIEESDLKYLIKRVVPEEYAQSENKERETNGQSADSGCQ